MHAWWPHTRVGWWAFVLATTSVVLFALNRLVMPVFAAQPWYFGLLSGYEFTTTICGVSGGICALLAWLVYHDAAWAVRVSVIPLAVFVGALASLAV